MFNYRYQYGNGGVFQVISSGGFCIIVIWAWTILKVGYLKDTKCSILRLIICFISLLVDYFTEQFCETSECILYTNCMLFSDNFFFTCFRSKFAFVYDCIIVSGSEQQEGSVENVSKNFQKISKHSDVNREEKIFEHVLK